LNYLAIYKIIIMIDVLILEKYNNFISNLIFFELVHYYFVIFMGILVIKGIVGSDISFEGFNVNRKILLSVIIIYITSFTYSKVFEVSKVLFESKLISILLIIFALFLLNLLRIYAVKLFYKVKLLFPEKKKAKENNKDFKKNGGVLLINDDVLQDNINRRLRKTETYIKQFVMFSFVAIVSISMSAKYSVLAVNLTGILSLLFILFAYREQKQYFDNIESKTVGSVSDFKPYP
jgi:hypothetical protein